LPAKILARHVKTAEETFPPRMEPENEKDENDENENDENDENEEPRENLKKEELI